jgi:gamma-glutamyl hydrolase
MKDLSFLLLSLAILSQVQSQHQYSNTRPIIGVLSTPSNFPQHPNQASDSYVLGTDVRFLESGGCRVVPIPWNVLSANLTFTLNSLNGIMIPGGPYSSWESSVYESYLSTVETIINYAVEQNQNGVYYPVLAVSSGFDLVSMVITNSTSIFENVQNSYSNHELNIQSNTRMYSLYPSYLVEYAQSTPVANFNNLAGLGLSSFQENGALSGMFNVAALSSDNSGTSFISALEGMSLPIYMAQYYPQGNVLDFGNSNYAHDYFSQLASTLLVEFFVNEGRVNTNSFPSPAIEDSYLIYNQNFVLVNATYPRVYFFTESV